MTVIVSEADVLSSDDLDQELRELELSLTEAKKTWQFEAKKTWQFEPMNS